MRRGGGVQGDCVELKTLEFYLRGRGICSKEKRGSWWHKANIAITSGTSVSSPENWENGAG